MELDAVVAEAAARHGVPAKLVMAVIAAESQFDPLAVSSRGALGLMQLMPATARILGVSDPFDPRENIEAGVRHLRAMLDLFDNNVPLALAAYNAGPMKVIHHRGVPPYRETRQYVSRILRRLDGERATSPGREGRGRRS
jgi:soluble lytic murein transglycosylase-like protein